MARKTIAQLREMKRHLIWSNYNVDPADFPECDDLDDVTADTEANFLNNCYFEDEKANLSHAVLPEELILIARLGLWDGSPMAYRVEGRASTVADCLKFERDCEYAEWYVEGNDLCSRQSHHDGTHRIIYRVWKPGLTETQRENFLDKVANQKATRRDITRYTTGLGKAVREIYGW